MQVPTTRVSVNFRYRFVLFSLALYLVASCSVAFCQDAPTTSGVPISFDRDIRPILSDKCFHCHGPDAEARKADLRFDVKEQAFSTIEPGKPEESELVNRVVSDDEDYMMPPPHINKPLSGEEKSLLKTWIAQGANWSKFWAYVPPIKRPLPETEKKFDNWIDQFVVARLANNGLALSPQADKITLIRRLYFDLIGLPPTPTQVKAFLNDDSPKATEKVVDELLASKHFGERLAIYWLDLVRYADTVGYHGDQDHNISPYRDWVINAFNENMPFDQFTREQLAGDLLPKPSQSQKIATGYNRLLQTTHEGGLQPKEYSAIYAADRVRNVSLVWMGATVGCAQCHDHKYDPYTAKDFYSLAAFFADIDDEKHFKSGTNALPTRRPPEMLVLQPKDKEIWKEVSEAHSKLNKEIGKTKKQLESLLKESLRDESKKAEYLKRSEALNELEKKFEEIKKSKSEIENRGAWTMISQPLATPRTIRVLPRGNWLDETGEVVLPAVPSFMGAVQLGGENKNDQRATRLDLANWFTDGASDSGKLTARVFANRFWYLLMGVGISKSLDDFGGQGEAPAYPELLDNLAIEFVENNWNIKQLIRQIVTSKTYQQASLESAKLKKLDPYNQLFAHQSRFRLPAELVRDNALAISGLLKSEKIGGKSIKPAQPAGYYQNLNFPNRKYKQHNDDRQWRRGVYIHWQRQFLHPTLMAFDAPTREECTCERPKSNTPSAALALLNDPAFVEAARMFADRIIRETAEETFELRLTTAYQLAVSRNPESTEIKILKNLFESNLKSFTEDPNKAQGLLSVGSAKATTKSGPVLAAWTTVARAILNMNETMSRD